MADRLGMQLSIVIPCCNGIDDTRACLRSLAEQREAPQVEVVVVDNASEDGTGELDLEFELVRVVRLPRNLGFAGGVNRGLHEARGDLVMVLNNDTLAAPHMVARLCAALESDPRIGLVAPVSNHVKGAARIDIGQIGVDREARIEIETALEGESSARLQDVETLSGLCLLFRRSLLDQVGEFDERFAIGGYEDDDFCLRARSRGHRLVVVRDAFLHHHGHRTFQALGQDVASVQRARLETFRDKWSSDPLGRTYLALLDGDEDAAQREAPAALQRYPDWPDGHLLCARARFARGEHAGALAALEEYLARCPAHGQAALLRSLALLEIGRDREACTALHSALLECHHEADAVAAALAHHASWWLRRGDTGAARALLTDARALVPDDPTIESLWQAAIG